jgi:hypothetical protein
MSASETPRGLWRQCPPRVTPMTGSRAASSVTMKTRAIPSAAGHDPAGSSRRDRTGPSAPGARPGFRALSGARRQLSDRERRSAGRFDAQIIAEHYTAIYARMLYPAPLTESNKIDTHSH